MYLVVALCESVEKNYTGLDQNPSTDDYLASMPCCQLVPLTLVGAGLLLWHMLAL